MITREWWDQRRADFDLYVSELVIDEVSAGDPEAAQRRLALLDGLPTLLVTDEARELTERLLAETGLPRKAETDAGHIAVAAVNGMHYLLTWNMTHIGNAEFREEIRFVCMEAGYAPADVCTPDELFGLERNDD